MYDYQQNPLIVGLQRALYSDLMLYVGNTHTVTDNPTIVILGHVHQGLIRKGGVVHLASLVLQRYLVIAKVSVCMCDID